MEQIFKVKKYDFRKNFNSYFKQGNLFNLKVVLILNAKIFSLSYDF